MRVVFISKSDGMKNYFSKLCFLLTLASEYIFGTLGKITFLKKKSIGRELLKTPE